MFAVVWLPGAIDELADVYVGADRPTKEAVAAAVERFNARLAADPDDVGESRVGRYRVDFDKPVAISFLVDEPRRTVLVVHLWTY